MKRDTNSKRSSEPPTFYTIATQTRIYQILKRVLEVAH